jgi:hypothetical protein
MTPELINLPWHIQLSSSFSSSLSGSLVSVLSVYVRSVYRSPQLFRINDARRLLSFDCLGSEASVMIFPVALPFGAPLPAAPPCIRQRVLPATAGDWQGVPRLVRARQRGAWRKLDGSPVFRCMGLSSVFVTIPPPSGLAHRANDCLPAGGRGGVESAFAARIFFRRRSESDQCFRCKTIE